MAYVHKTQLYEKQLTSASLSGQNIHFLKMLKHYLFSNHSKTVTAEFQRTVITCLLSKYCARPKIHI